MSTRTPNAEARHAVWTHLKEHFTVEAMLRNKLVIKELETLRENLLLSALNDLIPCMQTGSELPMHLQLMTDDWECRLADSAYQQAKVIAQGKIDRIIKEGDVQ